MPVLSKRPNEVRALVIFQDRSMCSPLSMESSRRDLSNDAAELMYTLKNYQSTYHPRIGFIPKNGHGLTQRWFRYCVPQEYFGTQKVGRSAK